MALTSVIDSANKVPGSFIQVSLGVGASSPGAAPIKVLCLGNKVAAGTQAVEDRVQVFSKEDARTLWGAGSELANECIAALKANPTVSLWATAVTEAGTAATGVITLTSGPATAAGTMEVWIGGRRVTAAIADGDTITVAALAIEVAINAITDTPVVALAAAGVVTCTVKNLGARGNDLSLRTKLTGATSISHTDINIRFTSGATSDDPQNALDAVAAERFNLIASPYILSAELVKFTTHTTAGATPETGLRQRWVSGSIATLAATVTIADATNAQRGQIGWHNDADDLPGEIAAALAAVMAGELNPDRAKNLDATIIPGLRVQRDSGDKPITTELIAALNAGITPLDTGGGEVFITRAITNLHNDSAGNPTSAVLDTAKVDVPDFIADDIELNFTAEFKGFKLSDDPALGDAPEPGVATPKSVRDWIYSRLTNYGPGGGGVLLLENVEARKDEIDVQFDAASPGRLNALIPVDVIERFHQLAGDIRQIG